MTIFSQVVSLLEEYPQCRNSDKLLMFMYWKREGLLTEDNCISWKSFTKAKDPESIRRARQKAQEKYSHLWPTDELVIAKRKLRQRYKGDFIFEQQVKGALL